MTRLSEVFTFQIKEVHAVVREDLKTIRAIKGGGMASLTLARGSDGAQYVIRELNRELAFNWRLRQGFINGLRIRQSLTPHPYILESKGMRTHRVIPYEILEYFEARNLNELISKKNEVVQRYHLQILRQIAAALTYMHNLNLVHLDVKAENVIVEINSGKDGVHARLTDFDLSRYLYRSWTRVHAGTSSYMAPEQLISGRVGFGNDIFAFGVLAYFLVSGKMPFSGFTMDAARQLQVNRKYKVTPLSKLYRGLTPRLEEIIMGCLEKELDKRFPTMAYLEQELRRV